MESSNSIGIVVLVKIVLVFRGIGRDCVKKPVEVDRASVVSRDMQKQVHSVLKHEREAVFWVPGVTQKFGRRRINVLIS